MKNLLKMTILLSSICPLLLGCQNNKKPEDSTDITTSTTEEQKYLINESYPSNNGVVSLANDDITEMVTHYTFACSSAFVTDEDHYASKNIEISWDVEEKALYYILELSTNNLFYKPLSYVSNVTHVSLDNLKPGYTYYWRINAYYTDKLIRSRVFNFQTMSIPKSIYMDSVKNFRDMGGFLTINNKRVKSGLIYRGANADGVSINDKNYMLNTLNIRSELDLRNKNEGSRGTNVLGVANYYVADDNGGFYYDTYPNGISYQKGRDVLAKEIKYFAERDNYPIYFHCAIGRDRTGSLAMVIYNLLGVSKKDIGIDYEISMFAKASTRDVHQGTVEELVHSVYLIYNYIFETYNGNNMQEKTEAFLLDIGVTQSEIDNIKNIMLEDI